MHVSDRRQALSSCRGPGNPGAGVTGPRRRLADGTAGAERDSGFRGPLARKPRSQSTSGRRRSRSSPFDRGTPRPPRALHLTDGSTATNRTAILVLAGTGSDRTLPRGLGRRGAASLREAMLRKTISTVRRGRSGAEVFVSLDPAEAAPAGTVALPQRGEDFEARLIDALERVFVRGYERVVTVVTDTPSLRARDLERAVRAPWDVLRQGPAPDGGLYLMTIRHAHLDRLRGLPWRTPRLRPHFVRALAETADHGSRLRWLPSRADVDRPEDVHRFDTVLRDLCSRYSDPLVLSPADLV